MLSVHIENDPLFFSKVSYTWSLFARFLRLPYRLADSREVAQLVIGTGVTDHLRISQSFYARLAEGRCDFSHHFGAEPVVTGEDGKPDYLSSVFYLINSLQEYQAPHADDVGRFPYEQSCQCHYRVADRNLVAEYFHLLFTHLKPHLPVQVLPAHASAVMLSHDIDLVYGAVWDDGRAALRRGRVDIALRLLFNAVLQRPDWFNMDKIMQVESAYGLRSVFFWLANRGAVNAREVNADYAISDARIRAQMLRVQGLGFENGLHKSISPDSHAAEMARFDPPPTCNRQHYLKFRLPELYRQCDEAGIAVDCSLGFAVMPGFRNSCGLAFRPYDLDADRSFSVTVCPLTIMDFSLFRYMALDARAAQQHILDFLDKHRYNALISLLWHNTFFSSVQYRDYPGVYAALLGWLHEQRWESVLPREVVGHRLCLS